MRQVELAKKGSLHLILPSGRTSRVDQPGSAEGGNCTQLHAGVIWRRNQQLTVGGGECRQVGVTQHQWAPSGLCQHAQGVPKAIAASSSEAFGLPGKAKLYDLC